MSSGLRICAELGLTSLFAITFLQSGLDKVFDRKGNVAYIQGVFAKTPLNRVSGLLLVLLTLMELVTGCVNASGVLLLLRGTSLMAEAGAVLSLGTLLCLFFGQRIAKDYVGAANLVIYVLAAVAALVLYSR